MFVSISPCFSHSISAQLLHAQEINYVKMALSKIEALHPNVLIVEKSASSYAQEHIFGKKDITLVLNVKKSLLERISRCTGAQIVSSIDCVTPDKLGYCNIFRTEKVFEKFSSSTHPKKNSSTTLMFFEGCPRRLGCTVYFHLVQPHIHVYYLSKLSPIIF